MSATEGASGTLACPTCGASVRAGARFCDSCGSSLAEPGPAVPPWAPVIAVPQPAPTAGTTPASAATQPGQYSADGKWHWNGSQWTPVKATKPSKLKIGRLWFSGVMAVGLGALLALTPVAILGIQGIHGVAGSAVVFGAGFVLLGIVELTLAVRYSRTRSRWARPGEQGVSRPRRHAGLVSVLVQMAAVCTFIAGLGVALPGGQLQAIWVEAASGLAAAAALALAALVGWRWAHGQRRKVWVTGAAGVLVVETVAAGGLNAYADSQVAPALALAQSYYAQVAVAVEQGSEVASGRAPAGVTFDTVLHEATAAEDGLIYLDPPGELVGYVGATEAWASEVAAAAGHALEGGQADVWESPAPFQMTMTADSGSAAVAAALVRIKTLMLAGNSAFGAQNQEGLLWVGAEMQTQSYWLAGVEASADPNWVIAGLHFIEPTGGGTAQVGTPGGVQLAAFHMSGGWIPRPRSSNPSCSRNNACLPWQTQIASQIQPALEHAGKAAVGGADCASVLANRNPNASQEPLCTLYTPADPPSNEFLAAQAGLAPLLGADFQVPSVLPSSPPNSGEEKPPASFVDACNAHEGSIYGKGLGIPQVINLDRVPTNEGGWICKPAFTAQPGANCWEFLTYTWSEYQGGGGGCPENGLVPPLGGPLAAALTRVGNFIGGLIPSGPVSAQWDGTYTMVIPAAWASSPAWQCNAAMAGGGIFNPPSWAGMTKLVVSGNSVVTGSQSLYGGALKYGELPIEGSGQAKATNKDAYGGSDSATYSFSSVAGVAHVAETLVHTPDTSEPPGTTNHSVYGPGAECTLTLTGTRI